LKAHYGYWHLPVSKEALLKLFGVENKKSYLMNTGMFKLKVLDVAVSEINELTELKILYKEEKRGKSIVGFDLHWSYGTIVPSATEKQMKHLEEIVLLIKEDMFIFINLQEKKNREEAIEMIKEIENMNAFLIRPAVITRDYANELIKKATNSLNRLNYFLKEDNQETIEVPLFNWLEGE
jgi:ribosome-binding ATPase YchF (GTP1/OBG family)